MFTGLIEQFGEVISNEANGLANQLTILAKFDELQAGESIAVNGVCLTLLPDSKQYLKFDVSPETLKLTSLGSLRIGERVNLERAMLASARLGGHYVSGHVDTTAKIHAVISMGEYIEMTIGGFKPTESKYLLPKGSITLNGVSLTINVVENNSIKVLLVPHTINKTTFGQVKIDERVNVEFDYLTRIIAHQLESYINSKAETC